MRRERRAGVLAHVTSVPSAFGAGDLGPGAVRFLDWISEAGFRAWQVLPVVPTGFGGSPYDGASVFAGNPWLVSPERLAHAGLLDANEVEPAPYASGRDEAARLRGALLDRAWRRFEAGAPPALRRELEAFAADPAQDCWLEDWCTFAALKRRSGGAAWTSWDAPLRRREPGALAAARAELADEIARERFVQFAFARQWEGLRAAAARRGVLLVGDAPFYVAHDSADVWTHRELFELDADGQPVRVAGVPPDYFSATGQLWGNPVYRWDELAARGYDFWVDRLRADLRRFDLLRLDHFRGFAEFWAVRAGETTAVHGAWCPGPGAALFERVAERVGGLPFIAEDLGVITPDVIELRDRLELPGMHVVQFAFDDEDSPHLPRRHRTNGVAYTGTHDNDTLRGWLDGLDPERRRRVRRYARGRPSETADRLVERTAASRAFLAVFPLQDVLALGSEARMNRPGEAHGNWRWVAEPGGLTLERAERWRALATRTGRVADAC